MPQPHARAGGPCHDGAVFSLSPVLLLVSAVARADDPDGIKLASFDTPKYAVTFPDDKRWDVEVLGTGLADVTNRHVGIGGMTVGGGYYILKNLAIQIDVSAYGFSEGHTNGPAIGATIGLRHHIMNIGKAVLFADVSFGEILADHDLPLRGTHRNNTFEFGLGVAYPIGPDVYLFGGPRFFHLSNANDAGGDRNPSINAVQGSGWGVMEVVNATGPLTGPLEDQVRVGVPDRPGVYSRWGRVLA